MRDNFGWTIAGLVAIVLLGSSTADHADDIFGFVAGLDWGLIGATILAIVFVGLGIFLHRKRLGRHLSEFRR